MIKKILIGLGLLLTVNAFASVVQGVDYDVISAPGMATATNSTSKVNIKEFFSFTCIHCKDIEPLLEATIMKNKKVELQRIQVPWDEETTSLAKLNATYQILGLDKLYSPTFNAMFTAQNLTQQQNLINFLKTNKVNVTEFMAVYNSFTVNLQVAQYKKLMKTYNITATPTFVVANQYVLKPAQPSRLIEVLQYLIKQQR